MDIRQHIVDTLHVIVRVPRTLERGCRISTENFDGNVDR
jgi:hypothetical protein